MIISVVICINLFTANTVFAVDKFSVFVNIYDEETEQFKLSNTQLELPLNSTVINTLDELKKKELILHYTTQDNKILQINFPDKTDIKDKPEAPNFEIYAKLNGETLSGEQVNMQIAQGDIIEWIYGEKKLPQPSQPPELVEPENHESKAIEWNDDYQRAMTDACDYLALNKETTTSYLIAMGAAARTLDVKMINDLLGQIRRTISYPSKTELAKTVISMTFAGYDASELVTILSDFKDSGDEPALEAIYVLLAYDCVNYEVSADADNARRTLIDIILKAQNSGGGFLEKGENTMDEIQLTAMAITALSNYKTRADVQTAIDKGVDFLAKSQTPRGNFLLDGNISTTLLSKVIIGLCSAQVGILDERFIKNGQNMVETLVKFQNEDGGFQESGNESTSSVATEQAVIALSAAKKNAYPYRISHSLIQMNKTPAEKLAYNVVNLPLGTIFLICIAITISLFAIIASFICKGMKKRNNK